MAIGRPSKRTPEVVERIIQELSKGTPLTVICEADDMPGRDAVYDWMSNDEELSRHIARAREAGFDQIALDALNIADNSERDTILTDKGGEVPNSEWISRSRLRVETRLKLLAKWDPKRYGDRIAQEITGADGGPVQMESSRTEAEKLEFAAMLAKAREG
jgi:hypothetical protein